MNSTEMASSDGQFVVSNTNHATPVPTKTSTSKVPKPPKPPEKPLMPYMRYSREIWESVKIAHPELKLSEIGRTIGRMWRELPQHEKQRYTVDYETEKAKYLEAFKLYQNSPAYQQYLAVKEKYQADEKETKAKIVSNQKPEPRFLLPACDNDEAVMEDLDYFHHRQVAAARFHRNQRLLQELFSDAYVPDLRQIITVPRLVALKRQVETLTMHQKKIDTEINQLVETFESKKRRLEDGARDFKTLLEKCTKPTVSPASFENLVEQAEHQLLEKYKAFVKRTQEHNSTNSTISNSSEIATSNSELATEKIDVTTDTNLESAPDHSNSPNGHNSTPPPKERDNAKSDVVNSEKVELVNGEFNGKDDIKKIGVGHESNVTTEREHKDSDGIVSNGSVNGDKHEDSS